MKRFGRMPDEAPVIALEPQTFGEVRLGQGGGGVPMTSKQYMTHHQMETPYEAVFAAVGMGLDAKPPQQTQLEWFHCAELLAASDLVLHRRLHALPGPRQYEAAVRPEAQTALWELHEVGTLRDVLNLNVAHAAEEYLRFDPVVPPDASAPQRAPALASAYWLADRPSAAWAALAMANYPRLSNGGVFDGAPEYRFADQPVYNGPPSPAALAAAGTMTAVLGPPLYPVDPTLATPAETPTVEVHLLDTLQNRAPTYTLPADGDDASDLAKGVIITDQDRQMLRPGGLCIGLQVSHYPELGTAAMTEGTPYVPLGVWMAKTLGNGNGMDPVGSTAETCQRALDRLQTLDLLAGADPGSRVLRQADPPRTARTSAVQATLGLRDKMPRELCLPHYFVDQDLRAPLLQEHLNQLQEVGGGLYRWREAFFDALGAILGQEAIVSWLDETSRKELLLRGEGAPLPELRMDAMSGEPTDISRHASLIIPQAMDAFDNKQSPALEHMGAAGPWLSYVYDRRALCWNTPVCVQEMRLYFLWAMQCRLDIARLERIFRIEEAAALAAATAAGQPAPQRQPASLPPPLLNLEQHFKTLIGGCCVAAAPFNSWMVPALSYFLLRTLPDLDSLWGPSPGPAEDEFIAALPALMREYVREKWFYTIRQDQQALYFRSLLDDLELDNSTHQTGGCYDYILLALIARRHPDAVAQYVQEHLDAGGQPEHRNVYKDVLDAVEDVVGVCMRYWAGMGDDLLDRGGLERDCLLLQGAAPPVPLRLASEDAPDVIYAVDAMAVWVQSGLVDGVVSALSIAPSGALRPAAMWSAWPVAEARRTRGPLPTHYGMVSRKLLKSMLKSVPAQLPLALRSDFPALAAALQLSAVYSLVPRTRHLFRRPNGGVGGGETLPFEIADWDTDSEQHEMFAVNRRALDQRGTYLMRQSALEHSLRRCELGQQWLRGPGAYRTWQAELCDLGVKACCVFPAGAARLRFTWSMQTGTTQRGDAQNRQLRQQSYMLDSDVSTSNLAELNWARDTLCLSALGEGDISGNRDTVFSTYGSVQQPQSGAVDDLALDPRVQQERLSAEWAAGRAGNFFLRQQERLCTGPARMSFQLAIMVRVDAYSLGGRSIARTERSVTVHGICSTMDLDSRSAMAGSVPLFFEVVHND